MKTNVRNTSINSYFMLRGSETELNQCGRLFAFMAQYKKPITRSELSELSKIRINAVCGRINQMILDGYIEETIKRECTISNRVVNTLVLTGKL